ncbi:MAG TPA: GAF domain-containing protein [Pyrinomonadaceae bacterium]|jgi:hypothetical protein
MRNKESQTFSHIFVGVLVHLIAIGIISILSYFAFNLILPFLNEPLDWGYLGVSVIAASVISYVIFVFIYSRITDRTKLKRNYGFHLISFLLILSLNASISATAIYVSKMSREKIEKAEMNVSDILNKCKDDFNIKLRSYSLRCAAVYYDQKGDKLRMPKIGCSGQNCNSALAGNNYTVNKKGIDETQAQACLGSGIFGYVFKNHEPVNELNLQKPQNSKICYKPVENMDFEQDISILCVPIDYQQKVKVGVVCVSSPKQTKFTEEKINEMKNFANQLSESINVLSEQYR